jgi:glutathione peroxidase
LDQQHSLPHNNLFSAETTRSSGKPSPSLYDLQCTALDGQPVNLGEFRGKVALVVNTASKCGLTPQYEGLEKLYSEFSGEGFVVLGFPSNDFLGQEPGSSEQIARFCRDNFHISFPLFAKSKVKGDERSEVYQLLTIELAQPTWNFTKYLVDRDGRVVARFDPRLTPDQEVLREAIKEELAKQWDEEKGPE